MQSCCLDNDYGNLRIYMLISKLIVEVNASGSSDPASSYFASLVHSIFLFFWSLDMQMKLGTKKGTGLQRLRMPSHGPVAEAGPPSRM